MKSCLYQFIFSLAQDNQRDLEQATEQLSEYLERDITSDILIDIKQKVQDKYRYCCHFTLQEKKDSHWNWNFAISLMANSLNFN